MFTGHILDDQDLIETLQKSKVMAAEIAKRIEQSEETEKKLNVARQRYVSVSWNKPFLCFSSLKSTTYK